MQRGYCVIRRGYCDGYPTTKKTNSGSCQRRLLSSLQAGEEGTLSSHSSFFKNNAHLNSGSNGIGGLSELRFLFGHGNSVESESLELELESAKTFARHILFGE